MKKILIVDDEKEIRELIRKKLEQNNYTGLIASSGQEALDICKTAKPDLVLLDIAMSGMDGYLTCEKLKEDKSTRDIPVLFLTAKEFNPESIIERYKNLGACGYIPKPSTLEELLKKIKEIIG